MDWVRDAVSYILEILNNKVLPLQNVLSEIHRAPALIRWSLTRQLQNLEQLENFLENQEDHFIVENGYVTAYDPDLASGRERAVEYYETELDLYDKRPHYLNFRGHVGQADEDIIDFINTFYPEKEFKKFLLAHPKTFIVFDDNTVALIENESVDYFEECLENNEGLHFMNLLGHVGQAPHHVIEFINTYYPGQNFVRFLEINPEVFNMDDGYVFLNPQDDD